MKEITTDAFAAKREADPTLSVIDVREDFEVAEGIIPGARHMPKGEVPERLSELDKTETHYIMCRSGARSGQVAVYMARQGYDAVNIADGMLAWTGATEVRSS